MNFKPITSDLDCKAAALYMGWSADPSAYSTGPIAAYTAPSALAPPAPSEKCYWIPWEEADRVNITFGAGKLVSQDLALLCAYDVSTEGARVYARASCSLHFPLLSLV